MTLITMLIVLSIERVAATSNLWQFEFYYLKMKNMLLKHAGQPFWLQGSLAPWLWVLVPVVVIQLIGGALDWLLFEFVFNVLVLLVCIGCIEKRKLYKSFLNAAARNDEEACSIYAAQLQGIKVADDSPPEQDVTEAEVQTDDAQARTQEELSESEPQQNQEESKPEERCGCTTLGLTLVWYNFRYYCAVLFWFVVLGPAGAVLYCMVRESTDDKDETVRNILPLEKMQLALHVLDWLPARICSAGYLLIGNFTKAANIWLSYLLDLRSSAKSLVSEISSAAETIDTVDCTKITEPACMLKLAKRNILFFLALVALLTLYGGLR